MARGWESKGIEDQQAEAERKRSSSGPREPGATDRRRTLELARAHTIERLRLARTDAQCAALERALADLDRDLAD